MTLKNAAFLAMIGTILATVERLYNLISAIVNVTQGLVPAVNLIPLLIYAFTSLTIAVFFFVFHRQS
jgi:hypothetical protein